MVIIVAQLWWEMSMMIGTMIFQWRIGVVVVVVVVVAVKRSMLACYRGMVIRIGWQHRRRQWSLVVIIIQ